MGSGYFLEVMLLSLGITSLAYMVVPFIRGDPNPIVSGLTQLLWVALGLLGLLALAVIAILVWIWIDSIRLRYETPEQRERRELDEYLDSEAAIHQLYRNMDLESDRPPATGEIQKNYNTHIREVFTGEEWVPADSDYTPVYTSDASIRTKNGYCWAVPLELENCLVEYFFGQLGGFSEFALTIEGRKYRLSEDNEVWLRWLMQCPENDERPLHTMLNESGIDAAQLEAHLRKCADPITEPNTELIAEIDEGEYVKRILYDFDFDKSILETRKRENGESEETKLVSSQGRSIKEMLEMLIFKKKMFSEAMRLAQICDWDAIDAVEEYAMRKRLDNLRVLFSQAQEAGESVWHDVVLKHYRWRIQLEDSRTAFWSVFFDDAAGEVVKYSLDIETASDSHYEFSYAAEKKLRRALGVQVESLSPTHEILIGHLKTNSRQSLESLAKSFCDQEFHYD